MASTPAATGSDRRTDHLLEGLNDAQREAVTSEAAPLCILAGAGSGKTRVLTRRIAHRVHTGSADAGHVLALTFTRKAAGELSSRLAALGVRESVAAGTFHAIAYAQLRRRWADRGQQPPALLDRKVRLLGPLVSAAANRIATTPGRKPAMVQPADVAAEIEWAKARLVRPEQYHEEAEAAGRTPPLPFAVMARLFERYEAEKTRRGLVDFDDLLVGCARLLAEDADFAAAQRWRFRHLFVDEFQDVNPVQFKLLTGWLGDRPDLCVVGDPNQAIYSWNGADPTLLTGFRSRFPTAEVVALEENYRSTPQVLGVANAVLAAAGPRPSQLRANRPDGAIPTVHAFDSDVQEARGIAARIRRLHAPGTAWSRIAVLTRTNAQLVLFEEAFRAVGIPFRVRGGGAFLDQPEVKDALAHLRRAPRSVPFSSHVADLAAMVQEADGAEERRLSLEGLIRLAREYNAADPAGSVEGFVAWLAATIQGDEPARGGDAVELTTFHRAKGLEWPIVFVAGLERGLAPIGHATTPEAEAEERRLVYVALTRAEEQLHCSWAERRTFGVRTLSRQASPYLETIERACRALEAGGPEPDWRALLADEKRRLRALDGRGARGKSASTADVPVLADLKAWRAATAKAASVPAYVIFHDSTLLAIAERRPENHQGLLAVPGLGPVKAARYGDALLEVLRRHGAA